MLHSWFPLPFCSYPVLYSDLLLAFFISPHSLHLPFSNFCIRTIPVSSLTHRHSLLHSAVSDPLTKIYRRASPTITPCPEVTITSFIPEVSTGFQTLTFLTPAPCPTSVVTAFDGPCTGQVPPPDCIEIACVDITTSTVGCPGGCCPTNIPTTTTTLPCTRQCGGTGPGSCPITVTEIATVGC